MKHLLFLVIFTISSGLSACGKKSEQTEPAQDNRVQTKSFQEDRTYKYSIFSSEEACKEWQQKHPGVNCYQWVEFSANGKAFMILTDMPNTGTYSVDQNQIHVSFTTASDSPKEMTFTLSHDQKSIINELDGRVWLREVKE